MAMADYYLCDICESKCFYDANLNWEWAERDNPIPEDEMVRGKHLRLGYCGDMAAICLDCAKTHEIRVVEIAAPQPVARDGWIPVSERLPAIKKILNEPCILEGNEVPTLYVSEEVLRFDGRLVTSGTVDWFQGKFPHTYTHWMPLPAAPEVKL